MGMTQQEVYERVGTPIEDKGEIEGVFWIQHKLTQKHELWIYFKNGKVEDFGIFLYIGTDKHFYKKTISGRIRDLPIIPG